MLSPISVKRSIKRVAGWSQSLLHLLTPATKENRACIFYYHRVADLGFTDPNIDDRNVSPRLFREQIAALSEHAEIVPLLDLPARLAAPRRENKKPLVSITFDDGYANFYTNVLPVLREFNVPASLAIVTGYLENLKPAPFDRWAIKNSYRVSPETWRLLKWKEIEECVASGLVTLGGHGNQHLRGHLASRAELQDEAWISAEILRRRFGAKHAEFYAYPYGNSFLGDVSEDYVEAVRSAGFRLATTTEVGLMDADTDIFRLPRLEAHDLDSARTLRAKAAGAIAPLYANEVFHKFKGKKTNGLSRETQIAAH